MGVAKWTMTLVFLIKVADTQRLQTQSPLAQPAGIQAGRLMPRPSLLLILALHLRSLVPQLLVQISIRLGTVEGMTRLTDIMSLCKYYANEYG
jgi:hypothetical protein